MHIPLYASAFGKLKKTNIRKTIMQFFCPNFCSSVEPNLIAITPITTSDLIRQQKLCSVIFVGTLLVS